MPALRRSLVTAAVMLAVAGVAGCGVGQGSEASREHAVEQAAEITSGDIQFNNVYINPIGERLPPLPGGLSLAPSDVPIVTPSTPPTPTASPSPGAAQGYLVATVTNSSDTATDRVLGAQITGASGATVSLAPPGAAPVNVPPNGQVHFNDPAATANGPFLVISGMTTPLTIGTSVTVTFTVAGEGQLPPIQVPIVNGYAGPPPSTPPVPTGSVSATANAGSGTGKAGGTSSPSAAIRTTAPPSSP